MRILAVMSILALATLARTEAANPLPPVNTRPSAQLSPPEMLVAVSRSEFDVGPKFVSGAAPMYPITRLRLREPGYATIRFTVDETGHTRDFEVVKTNYPYFASHAVAAVQKWRFEPAKKKGRPVPCRIETPFRYRVGR